LQGGVIVCQHWQLRRGLGSSPGRAWEAEDLRSGRRVAIKFLRGPQSLDEPTRQRFEREARAFGRVRSPHYVQILDQAVSEHGVPFLVTELLDGEDVSVLLANKPRLGLLEAGRILDQVLRGLGRLQSLRLVHREIKPENVFLVDAGDGTRTAKVLDFGFARSRGRDASPLASGSPWHHGAVYWSPEQIATPARADQRTDVWATGVLGYRMLTGQLPFPCDDWSSLAQRVQAGTFAPVSALCPELPPALDGWFRQMLHPELLARFAGAEPARMALEQILQAQPVAEVVPARVRVAKSGPPPLPRSAPPPLPPSARVPALVMPAEPLVMRAGDAAPSSTRTAEQGVRVGTLLVCGLLLVSALAGVFALRTGSGAGLRSQAAAAERTSAAVRPSPAAAGRHTQPSAAAESVRVAAPAPAPLQLSAAVEPGPPAPLQLSVAVEPGPPAPLQLSAAVESSPPAAPHVSTAVAAERLRSRSAGARLTSGATGLPVMEGGPRAKRSPKPTPAPSPVALPPAGDPPASSAPPPAATRPYRGF
jgi:hypothetical protein